MPKEDIKPEKQTKKPDKKPILLGAASGLVVFLLLGGVAVGVRAISQPHETRPYFNQTANGGFGNRSGMRGMRPTSGEVTKIDGKIITIKTTDSQSITVNTDDNTHFRKNQSDAQLSDIKTGDTLAVVGRLTDNQVTARAVIINPDFTPGQ